MPQHPASFAPLSIEDPVLAETAARGANILASDRLSPILTDWLAARKSARAGVAPLWDPAAGLGAPLAAGSVAGLLYPPNLINLVLPPEFAGAWAAMLALFLAGLGMALFLGRVGLGGGPALVGAIAIQAGAFAIANLHYGVKVDAALYLPWSLWAAEGLARRRPGAGALLFLFTALSFLAGFPPIALFAASAVLLHAGGQALAGARWRAAFRRTGASPARPPLAATRADSGWGAPALVRVCAWLFLGLAGAAVQLIPTAELSLLSTRQGRTPADLQAESLPPATLAGLPVANLFGSPQLAVPPAVLPAVLPAVFPPPTAPPKGGSANPTPHHRPSSSLGHTPGPHRKRPPGQPHRVEPLHRPHHPDPGPGRAPGRATPGSPRPAAATRLHRLRPGLAGPAPLLPPAGLQRRRPGPRPLRGLGGLALVGGPRSPSPERHPWARPEGRPGPGRGTPRGRPGAGPADRQGSQRRRSRHSQHRDCREHSRHRERR
ncbi:MAG TPA: hypothetical protein QF730_09135 [Planctomycetota bacterium]|nr:hypothetical protein [Planctomycetota bacterium]